MNNFKAYITLLSLDGVLCIFVCRSGPATFSVRKEIIWSISSIRLYISAFSS